MKKILFILAVMLLMTQLVWATNYYSGGNDAPNLQASWWTGTGGTGSHPTNFTTAGNIFIIQAGHTMTTTATWTVSGTGSAVQINGTLVASNTVTIPSASTVNSGGTYQHNINSGTIPTATWNTNSTCLITGLTTTICTTVTTTFGNFIWNCPSQNFSTASALAGTLTFNNLTVLNTGTNATSGQFRIQTSPITVNGDLNINGGIMWVAGQAAKTMNVAGDVNITGGKLYVSTSSTAANSGILNVTGNVNISGGTLKIDSSSAPGTLNVTGNFSHTGGTIARSGSSATSGIIFNKTGIQTYTSGGILSDNVNFTVNSGSILQMADASTVISGGGTFTLASGATLGITSSAGITSSGATGNIQVTGTRTFNTGANYIYNGSAQATGNGLPATVTNLTLAGSGAKTRTNAVTVNGILTMGGDGTVSISAAPTYGTSASLQYTGTALQTTGPEFLSTMNKTVLIHNSIGVALDAPKTITNTLTIQDCYLDNSINALTVGAGGSVVLVGTGSLVAPLPVEMTSFTAVMQGTSAVLNWSTATEVNNNGFEIERRAVNGEQVTVNSWIKVGFVPGAGTSNSPKSYSFQDAQLAPGAYVYRIKQIDNNGAFEYSASTQVDAGVSNALQLDGNYPNPFNPTTNIQFSVPENGYASLKVYNMIGQEVATLFSGMATAGHYIPATFNASRLASGIYFARLQYNGKSLVQRMLLTK